jgi:hypothetical protein
VDAGGVHLHRLGVARSALRGREILGVGELLDRGQVGMAVHAGEPGLAVHGAGEAAQVLTQGPSIGAGQVRRVAGQAVGVGGRGQGRAGPRQEQEEHAGGQGRPGARQPG